LEMKKPPKLEKSKLVNTSLRIFDESDKSDVNSIDEQETKIRNLNSLISSIKTELLPAAKAAAEPAAKGTEKPAAKVAEKPAAKVRKKRARVVKATPTPAESTLKKDIPTSEKKEEVEEKVEKKPSTVKATPDSSGPNPRLFGNKAAVNYLSDENRKKLDTVVPDDHWEKIIVDDIIEGKSHPGTLIVTHKHDPDCTFTIRSNQFETRNSKAFEAILRAFKAVHGNSVLPKITTHAAAIKEWKTACEATGYGPHFSTIVRIKGAEPKVEPVKSVPAP
jgi:hypothetical protein